MIISGANQKRGVGKTTIVVHLASWFASKGKKVLLVDFDQQGHCSRLLRQPKGDGLYRLLVDRAPVREVVVEARPNLDLVTSDKRTNEIRNRIQDVRARDLYIARVLAPAVERYDLIFLDLAPGSDLIHVGALVASDLYLAPANMDFLALDGIVEVMNTVASLTEIPTVEPPGLIGVVPTMYERSTSETAENVKRLGELVGMDLVLPPVPRDTHVREAAARGMTLWEYAPDSPAAVGYKNGSKVVNSKGNTGGLLHLAEIVEMMVR